VSINHCDEKVICNSGTASSFIQFSALGSLQIPPKLQMFCFM